MLLVGVFPTTPSCLSSAQTLARELDLPLITDSTEQTPPFLLLVSPDSLSLKYVLTPNQKPLTIDFLEKSLQYRCDFGGGKQQLIARAVGLPSPHLTVIDATAGLGKDAFLLASLGCHVTALERSAVLGKLIRDGLERFQKSQGLSAPPFRFIQEESVRFLSSLAPNDYPEVVYLDPMYPERYKKSAKQKKEMVFLRELVGEDTDATALLEVARKVARKRVVVKRPLRGEGLGPKPNFSYKSESTRFDIYLSSPKTFTPE